VLESAADEQQQHRPQPATETQTAVHLRQACLNVKAEPTRNPLEGLQGPEEENDQQLAEPTLRQAEHVRK
jgi:hypothetical protein